jgi:hypothetical protein
MTADRLPITPQTKVGELLEAYPELENVIMGVAPAFKKLQSPLLRRTVARVTSLAQAARVGGVSVAELVTRLRREVGQPDLAPEEADAEPPAVATAEPGWFDSARIVKTLDARLLIEAGEHPIGQVLRDLDRLGAGEIYELITPFTPAPLIDQAEARGCVAFTKHSGSDETRTYFARR